MSLPVSAPSRKAALLLHALQEPELGWDLNGLLATQQDELRNLLGELQALGIPADRDALNRLSGTSELAGTGATVHAIGRLSFLIAVKSFLFDKRLLARTAREASPGWQSPQPQCTDTLDHLAQLQAHQIEVLALLLRDEPDRLVARLLSLRPWPWHEELLSRFELVQQARIQRVLNEMRSPLPKVSGAQAHAQPSQSAPALERAMAKALLQTIEMRSVTTHRVEPVTRLRMTHGLGLVRDAWSSLRHRFSASGRGVA